MSGGGEAPLVSVVMPVRDGAATVLRAARSILEGTLTQLELICVDDGSQDETAELLRALAAADRRLTLLRQAPLGIVAALQRGWQAARAPLVARMDADDWSHPRRLERQVALLRARPSLGLVGCQVRIQGSAAGPGMKLYEAWCNDLLEPEALRRERFVDAPLVHPTWLLRRSLLEAAGGYRDGVGPEDYDLLLRLFAAGLEAAKVPEVLLHWTDEPQRLTRQDPRCHPDSLRRLKVQHLLAGPLAGGRPYLVQGAGPTGKAFVRALLAAGHPPAAFVELDPDKIGQRILGLPVLPLEALLRGERRDHLLLVAVAALGAKPVVRAQFARQGRREGEDALFVA